MEDRTPPVAGGGPRTAPHILGLDRKRTKGETPPSRSLQTMEQAMQDSFRGLTFQSAFDEWLKTHTPFIADRTRNDYEDYGAALCEFLGDRLVEDIGYAGVRAYQLWRSRDQGDSVEDSYQHAAGNVRIKNEINCVLKPILKEAGFWQEIKQRKFRHLPIPREGAGSYITHDEERELLEVAFSIPKLNLIGHVIRIMFRTGCGFGEIRRIRRQDADLDSGLLFIVLGAKNDGARKRRLTLTASALESLAWLVARWERKGGEDQNGYILPHRSLLKGKGLGSAVPMASVHRAWTAVKREWIKAYPDRASRRKLRLYDIRVTVAIRLLRNGKLSLPTIKKALGWAPPSTMVDRYYKPEQDMLREALNTLEEPPINQLNA